jgi:hypothetical protein
MDMEKAKRVVGEVLEKLTNELQKMAMKNSWSSADMEYMGKLLEHMEKAGCLMAMAEQGGEGYSGRRGYSRGYAGDGYHYSGGNMGYSHADGQNYNEGYSERMRGANGQYRSGENYSGHSIEDRMIADMESMAGRAGNDYERKRIQEGIEALRRVFN